MKLFIFTLNWNGADKLKNLYPNLINNLSDLDYTWWIKDNGSIDESLQVISSFNNDRVKVLSCEHNSDPFALGMNRLFKEANPEDEDIILLLNNDIVFNDNNSIKNMLKLIDNNKVGVVGARLLYPNSDLLQHAGVIFHSANRLPVHFKAKAKSDRYDKLNREFQAVTGAVWMTKAAYYRNIAFNEMSQLHGLDESYVWMYEDIDACLNIKYVQKKKVVYCGNTSIFHEESSSLKKNPMNRIYLNHNINTFRRKWHNVYQVDDFSYLNNPNHLIFNPK